jgi:hypothetical protein
LRTFEKLGVLLHRAHGAGSVWRWT